MVQDLEKTEVALSAGPSPRMWMGCLSVTPELTDSRRDPVGVIAHQSTQCNVNNVVGLVVGQACVF